MWMLSIFPMHTDLIILSECKLRVKAAQKIDSFASNQSIKESLFVQGKGFIFSKITHNISPKV